MTFSRYLAGRFTLEEVYDGWCVLIFLQLLLGRFVVIVIVILPVNDKSTIEVTARLMDRLRPSWCVWYNRTDCEANG